MLLYIICLFVCEKQKGRGITQTPVSTAEPTATVYLYKNLLLAKNCMVDGRLHEFRLSICGPTTITVASLKKLKKKKKKLLISPAPRLPVRPCSEAVMKRVFCWIPQKHLIALSSSLRWRPQCQCNIVCGLWMWARTLRASFSNFIPNSSTGTLFMSTLISV